MNGSVVGEEGRGSRTEGSAVAADTLGEGGGGIREGQDELGKHDKSGGVGVHDESGGVGGT